MKTGTNVLNCRTPLLVAGDSSYFGGGEMGIVALHER